MDNFPASCCDHMGQNALAKQECAEDIDRKGFHPLFWIYFPKRADWTVASRCIHQHIDTPEGFERSLDQMIHLPSVGDIGYLYKGCAAGCSDLRGHSIQLGSGPCCQDELCSLFREAQSNGLADTSSSAHYHCHFVLQP